MATQDLADLRIYQLAMKLGEDVYATAEAWPWFAKEAMGLQIVKAADSVAANISEGYGRYSFKENARFCYYARGSLRETATWLEKARNRNPLSVERFENSMSDVHALRRQLDRYIRSIGKTKSPSFLGEEESAYDNGDLPPLEEFLLQFEPEHS